MDSSTRLKVREKGSRQATNSPSKEGRIQWKLRMVLYMFHLAIGSGIAMVEGRMEELTIGLRVDGEVTVTRLEIYQLEVTVHT